MSSAAETLKNEEEFNNITAANAAKEITSGVCDISHFVEKLGIALTSPSVEMRVNGTKLLSETLALLPKDLLTSAQLEFLVKFYADRLKDHHNLWPPIIDGIDSMIGMTQLPGASVPELLRSFFQHTTCQSQVRSDRAKLFRIFKQLSEQYVTELETMKGDFIYGIINSIDGERDPRNLEFIFSFMPDFIARFPLLHLSEEMFEIFACYFPIDFNPSKNDPDTITRDNLAAKLTNCLVASPLFVEWAIALAVDKLDSDLVVAKLDALELLHQSAFKFAPTSVEPQFEHIWIALKKEIFPGTDNIDIVSAALRTLRSILEQAATVPEISHNYQTIIMGLILSHLADVSHRLFNPATAIALVCVAGDAQFACDKIFNTFLLKLQEKNITDEERLKVYAIVAQIFKISALRSTLAQIDSEVCVKLQTDVIKSLLVKQEILNIELKHAALSVLNECTPIIDESNRALLYKALLQLIMDELIDLELASLLTKLAALHPIELQAHCLNACIDDFDKFSPAVQRKIYNNLLALLPQAAFAQRVLDLVLAHVFPKNVTSDESCLLALEALNTLLKDEDNSFVKQLQQQHCLIDKLITLAQTHVLELPILEEVASAISQIVQKLDLAEQYAIATQYLPQLNLQLAADLFVAKGLLGFLHAELSLDDHFEQLLKDLTKLSLESENTNLQRVAQHLLCSLVNKCDNNIANRSAISKIIAHLKTEIARGNAKAVEALAWLAKGLIVRGQDEAGDIVESIAELLDHPSLSNAACLAFEIISAEYPQLHLPIVKFLFKQRYFHLVLTKLGHKLETFCDHHLKVFVYVMQATPHAVLKMNVEKIGPLLFKCLDTAELQTVSIALGICTHFIKEKDEYFRSHLNHIIASCLQLSKFSKSMKVRIMAINLLYDITKYPTFVLLPHKIDVVLELAVTLNDPKRLVRNAAVRANNTWCLIGAPNTED